MKHRGLFGMPGGVVEARPFPACRAAGYSGAGWLAAWPPQASSRCQAFGAQHQAMFHTAGGKPWYAAVRKPNCQEGSMEVLKDAASTGWVPFSQPVKLNELGGPHYPTWHNSVGATATGGTVL